MTCVAVPLRAFGQRWGDPSGLIVPAGSVLFA